MIQTQQSLMTYIYQTKKGKYRICKKIKGKTHHFGEYPTLEISQEIRDLLVQENWNLEKVQQKHPYLQNRYKYYQKIKDKYRVRKIINGKTCYYGTYHTEQEAKERVAFLKKHNWDMKYTINPPTPGKYPRNIRYNQKYNKYYIQKQIKKQYYYSGLFDTLTEAINERNKLSQSGWDIALMKKSKKREKTKNYAKTSSGYYVKKSIKGEVYTFGRYDTEEEAQTRVEFLKKHNWNTKYAIKQKKSRNKDPQRRYITRTKTGWKIQKVIEGKLIHFNTFSSLENAIAERDWLEKAGWTYEGEYIEL